MQRHTKKNYAFLLLHLSLFSTFGWQLGGLKIVFFFFNENWFSSFCNKVVLPYVSSYFDVYHPFVVPNTFNINSYIVIASFSFIKFSLVLSSCSSPIAGFHGFSVVVLKYIFLTVISLLLYINALSLKD